MSRGFGVKTHSFDSVGSMIQRYLKLADEVAAWSKDPSSKFGCFLTDHKFRPVGFGYNGFARGFEDTPERWNDREFKYRHVIHAEENALLNMSHMPDNGIAFVNGCPCASCMSKLAQREIKQVWAWEPTKYYLERWSIEEPRQVAIETKIDLNFVKRKE